MGLLLRTSNISANLHSVSIFLMKEESRLYLNAPLMLGNIKEKMKHRERLMSDPIPSTVFDSLRKQINMQDLRVVQSVTAAKKTLQKKYYSRKKEQVVSLDESIQDEASFDRKLKLFLFRRKKMDLVSYLEKESGSKIRHKVSNRTSHYERGSPKRSLVESATFFV